MPRTVVYIGSSHIRKISAADWTSLGISQADTTWDKSNNFQQVVTDQAALWLLANPGEFVDELGLKFGDLVLNDFGGQLGGRLAAMGDSLTAGVTESGKGTAGPFANNNLNYNSWPFQLVSMNPLWYRMLANAGVGGDVWGGKGKLLTAVGPGTTTCTFSIEYGAIPWGSQALWFGGFFGGNPDGKTFSGIVDNGNGTATVTGIAAGIVNTHGIGDEVGWGMIGRVKDNLFTYKPDTIIAMAGTNNLNNTPDDKIAYDCAADFGTLCRMEGIDVVFTELLPRSTYQSNVMRVNTYMRDMCAKNGYDLIKVYDAFASTTGGYLVGGDTTDGLHLTVQGIKKYTAIVHSYLADKGIQRRPLVLAQANLEPDNLLTAGAYFNGATTASLTGECPTDVTVTSFFGVNIRPRVKNDTGAEGLGDSKWLCLEIYGASPSGNVSCDIPLSPAPSIGDRLLITGRAKSVGQGGGCQVTIQFIDNVFNITALKTYLGPDDDIYYSVSSTVGGISAALLRFQLIASTTSAVGEMKLNRPRVINLTTKQILY